MGAEIVHEEHSEEYQVFHRTRTAKAENMLVVNLKLLEGYGELCTYEQISSILDSKYNLNKLTKEEYLEIVNFF